MRRSALVAPIHAVAPAALLARHFPGTPRHVLALVAPRAYEVRLMHHAPRLGPDVEGFERILGHADLDAVDVGHPPRVAGLLHHSVQRTTSADFRFRPL